MTKIKLKMPIIHGDKTYDTVEVGARWVGA